MDNQNTPFSKSVKQPTVGALFILLLVGAMIGFQLGRWSNRQEKFPYVSPTIYPTGKVCTQEVKLCSDGSYVGRTGPNCEFAPCPTGTPDDKQNPFCGGIAGIACPEGYSCQYEGNYPDAGGTCVKSEYRLK